MNHQVNGFLKYLNIEKNSSHHTITKYSFELKNLLAFLNDKYPLTDFKKVKITDLRKYLEYIKDKNSLSHSSVSNKIAIIKSFFRYLKENNFVDSSPAVLLKLSKKPRKIPKFLNDIELAKLLASPDRVKDKRFRKFIIRDKLILYLLAYTGLRKSELINLDWEHINLGSKYLIVRKGKNKTDRIIPLHKTVTKLLDEYLSIRLPLKNKALFLSERGNRISPTSLDCLFKRYLKFSGLVNKKYTLHTLRHTFATRLLNKNVSLFRIKNLLGHRSIESTEIYLHTTSKELADSIDLL